MVNKIKNLISDEKGQGMTEYGLVLGVIAIAVVGILVTMRDKITQLFTKADANLTKALE